MKTNAQKIPATQADVRRARKAAVEEAVRMCTAIFLTVLCDKFNAAEEIPELLKEMGKLSEEIKEGRVSVRDLIQVLLEEYGIEI